LAGGVVEIDFLDFGCDHLALLVHGAHDEDDVRDAPRK
jgi:hypothetical protein